MGTPYYRRSEAGRAAMREASRRYRQSEHGKVVIRAQRTRMRASLKEQVYNLLGDRCARCGFVDARALQIDHVYNDGYKEQKLYRYGYQRLVRILTDLKAGLHGKYQILCANCNWIKREMARESGEYRG